MERRRIFVRLKDDLFKDQSSFSELCGKIDLVLEALPGASNVTLVNETSSLKGNEFNFTIGVSFATRAQATSFTSGHLAYSQLMSLVVPVLDGNADAAVLDEAQLGAGDALLSAVESAVVFAATAGIVSKIVSRL